MAQQAVKQEAVPALLELSHGLTGSSPHCLQRVLCRLTSHANELSLLPRMALHMFRWVGFHGEVIVGKTLTPEDAFVKEHLGVRLV